MKKAELQLLVSACFLLQFCFLSSKDFCKAYAYSCVALIKSTTS